MVNKQIQLTATQREKKLLELIEHAKKQGFYKGLIKTYELQLKEVQAEIQRDKLKRLEWKKK